MKKTMFAALAALALSGGVATQAQAGILCSAKIQMTNRTDDRIKVKVVKIRVSGMPAGDVLSTPVKKISSDKSKTWELDFPSGVIWDSSAVYWKVKWKYTGTSKWKSFWTTHMKPCGDKHEISVFDAS